MQAHLRWLRLSEAIDELKRFGLSERQSRDWIGRQISDRLVTGYGFSETVFRLPERPYVPQRGSRVWLTRPELDWAQSTIAVPHRVNRAWRYENRPTMIEVSAAALEAQFGSAGNKIEDGLGVTRPLQPAPEAMIRKEIEAVYDAAAGRSEPPPNIKRLPKDVRPRLNKQGYDAADRHIADIGCEFANRRRKPGKTLASERHAGTK